jgi:hypothetical protein
MSLPERACYPSEMGTRIGLLLWAAAVASAELLTPVWVQAGDHGQALARVVVNTPEQCPSIQLDGVAHKMELRQPVPENFRPACETAIPPGTLKASVNGRKLQLPRPNPTRIIAFGDTGCRIKGAAIQNCNDPAQWPFERVARAAAAAHPHLILDVGAYLYREDPCPAGKESFCGGTPHGDNWETWDADFFKPASALLEAAPWVFARGNHETCSRSWRGWSYYLDTHPWTGVCQLAPPPVLVELGTFKVVLFDSSATTDTKMPAELIDTYASHLAGIHVDHAWLLDHHPFWALKGSPNGQPPAPQNAGLEEAWDKAAPKGIDMVFSGHTHVFELLSFGGSRPVQLVAGNGGTNLEERIPSQVKGIAIQGFMIAEGETEGVYGYTLLQKTDKGWKLALREPAGESLVKCSLDGNDVACKMLKH